MVGTDATYAPAEFLDTDGKTVDRLRRRAVQCGRPKLGLKAEFVSAPFDAIITGRQQSGKYEIGVSSFTINDERKQSANMVSYFQVGTPVGGQEGQPGRGQARRRLRQEDRRADGTVQVEDLTGALEEVHRRRQAGITIEQYQGQDRGDRGGGVRQGRRDAGRLAGRRVRRQADRRASSSCSARIYDAAPYGYVVEAGPAGVRRGGRDALEALIADGGYETALDKWGVGAGAITDPAINP